MKTVGESQKFALKFHIWDNIAKYCTKHEIITNQCTSTLVRAPKSPKQPHLGNSITCLPRSELFHQKIQDTWQHSRFHIPYLAVVLDIIPQADQARLEFLGFQAPAARLVEVEEGLSELVHLFTSDALGVPCQDLEAKWQVNSSRNFGVVPP